MRYLESYSLDDSLKNKLLNVYSNEFVVEKLDESTIGIGRGSRDYNGISITYDETSIGIGGGLVNGLLLEDLSKKAINI